jgi:hypothetical protein
MHGNYSKFIIAEALKQQQKGLTQDQALYIVKKARKPPPTKLHGNSLLTIQQEAVIVTWVMLRSESRQPIHKIGLGEIVRNLLGLPETWNCSQFLKSFLKRNKKFITPRRSKEITPARASMEIISTSSHFVKYMDTFFTMHYFSSATTFNVDECQLDLHTYEV